MTLNDPTPATVMPVIGRDGMLLGVTINGVTCVREAFGDYQMFADVVLNRIVTLARDNQSAGAKALLERDDKRIARLYD